MSTITKWFASTNAVLGLWLIAAPFVLGVSGAGFWNAVVVGSLIALASGYNWYGSVEILSFQQLSRWNSR